MKQALKPQSLLAYKEESEATKISKKILLDIQNASFNKEMQKLNKEKEELMKQRMKRLKYLYRKKTKGVNINLRNINKSVPDNPKEGQAKRIRQYEHYICKKIGLVSHRRDLLRQVESPDPTKKYEHLKPSMQEEEEKELKKLIEYFENQEDESMNALSFKVGYQLFVLP